MGKANAKLQRIHLKFLNREVEYLTASLGKDGYSPEELLGEILMELYDIARLSSFRETEEAHAKVCEVIESARKGKGEALKSAYEKYFPVYQGLCRELKLDEKPNYAPKIQELVLSDDKKSSGRNGKLLTKTIGELIVDIETKKLGPEDFLRRGLDELADIVADTPFPEARFSAARQTYAHVRDFLGSSGIYDPSSYRQEYQDLLKLIKGKKSESRNSDSAGIGKAALAPSKDPRPYFKKALLK